MSRRKRRGPCLLLAGAVLAGVGGLSATTIPPAEAVSPGTTEVASVGAEGNGIVGAAEDPVISADGQQVAFESRAALDPAVRPSEGPPDNIFVRDRRSAGRTVLISRALPMTYLGSSRGNSAARKAAAPLEEGGNADSTHPAISADGRYVAFESRATNLQDGYPGTGLRIVLCDRDPDGDGILDEQRTNGTMDYHYLTVGRPVTAAGSTAGSAPSLSADGGVIAWLEQPPGTILLQLVVARLIKDGAGRPTAPLPDTFLRTSLEDVSHASPQVSADGHHVAFATADCEGSLVCVPGSETIQVFEPGSRQTHRIDVLPDGAYSGQATRPSVSGSGRFIAYEHRLGVGRPVVSVVVDRAPAGGRLGPSGGVPVSASIASRDTEGQPQEGRSPALSADGRYLAFQSAADKLHGDAQGTDRQTIVLRDLTLDSSRELKGLPRPAGELGSPAASPNCGSDEGMTCPALGPSGSPRLSADGSVVAFVSAGDDLLREPCCAGAVFTRELQPRIETMTTDFGPVGLGASTERTVVLRNVGFGPLVVDGLSLSGTDAQEFALPGVENCAGTTLHATETCSVAVSFAPTVPGPRQAVLRVRQPDGTTDEVNLIAEGTETPAGEPPMPPGPPPLPRPGGQLVIAPDPLDFGGSQPALVALAPRTLHVRNAAAVPVVVTSVGVLEGPRFTIGEFAVVESTCTGTTLAPGATCSIEVSATPHSGGQRNGVLAVTTADPAYSRLVALRSRAAQPALQVNPGVVRMNRVAAVTGQNFPPGRAVTLALSTPGSRVLVNTTAGSDGTISAALLIFPQTSAGTWPVVATAGGTTVRAHASVLVVPGSYQPPGFTSRR